MSSRGTSLAVTARNRKGFVFFWIALFLCSLLAAVRAVLDTGPSIAAHNEGIFELEGNADRPGGGRRRLGERNAEGAADSFFVGAASEAPTNDDTYFTGGGSKDENDISRLGDHRQQRAPDKDELLDAYAAVYQIGGDTWVYFGADRFDNDGTAQIGFWFFQDERRHQRTATSPATTSMATCSSSASTRTAAWSARSAPMNGTARAAAPTSTSRSASATRRRTAAT